MDAILDFLNQEVLENTYGAITWFLLWIIGALVFKGFTANILVNILTRMSRKRLYDIPAKRFREILSRSISFFIFIIVLYISVQYLDFPTSWEMAPIDEFGIRWILKTLYGIAFGVSLIYVFLRVADCVALILSVKYRTSEEHKSIVQVIPFATDLTKVIIAILGILIILGTLFKVNVAAMVAGLGVGGLAIALAAKETLENLLGSFIIYFDKPFNIGDSIKLGDEFYTVEKVGLRSTRLRTYSKTLMTVPNKTLVEGKIDNYSDLLTRTIVRTIQISRETKHAQVQRITTEITEYIKNVERSIGKVEVSLHNISQQSLDLRIYYSLDATWAEHLEDVENINLKIMEVLEKNDSSLAIPHQYVEVIKK